jgi:hypothetical protein
MNEIDGMIQENKLLKEEVGRLKVAILKNNQ